MARNPCCAKPRASVRNTWNYEQTALVTNVLTQRFHDHVAYERFTPSGPLALLPMSEGRLGLIWTFTADVARVGRAGERR